MEPMHEPATLPLLTFFDIHKNAFVQVDKKDIVKFVFTRKDGEKRYGLRGVITDGQSATKFVDKADWDAIDVAVATDGT